MAPCGRPTRLAASLSLVLLSIFALPSASLPASTEDVVRDVMQRRASYWPGMWQFDRGDGSGYGDYYYGGERPAYAKRGYFRPGMWQFERPDSGVDKRAYFWPGMWRHQQRRPSKRSYGYGYYNDHPYWLGKACGETGDMVACAILSDLHYY